MNPLTCKSLIAFFFFSFAYSISSGQQCEVEKENLKGAYTGGCKKGKAHGKGKATGTDVYDGEFKSGQPDGEGTYTWSNGNIFTGKYSKGLRDGKGTMIIKSNAQQDSVVDGYWKKDVYIGKYESPYKIISKTKAVADVQVEYTKDDFNRISFSVTNTSGAITPANPRAVINDIQIFQGSFTRSIDNNTHYKKTEKIIFDIITPLRVKLVMGSEELEIVFNEQGSYTVDIRIAL